MSTRARATSTGKFLLYGDNLIDYALSDFSLARKVELFASVVGAAQIVVSLPSLVRGGVRYLLRLRTRVPYLRRLRGRGLWRGGTRAGKARPGEPEGGRITAGKRSGRSGTRAFTDREIDLGRDPASGGKLRMHEVECATKLEARVGKLTRDPSGKGDWIDAGGKVYDGIGPVKERVPYKIDDFIDSIRRHLASENKLTVQEFVVDVRRLSADEVAQVERVVDSLRGTTTRTISIQG